MRSQLLVVAICAAAVVCAAAEPENTWSDEVADAADLVARSGPLHTLMPAARAASAVLTQMEGAPNNDVVPEEDFTEVDGWLSAPAKAAKKAPKKAATPKKAAAPKAKKAAPKAKKTAAKKPSNAKKTAKKAEAKKGGAKKAAAKKAGAKKGTKADAHKAVKKVAKKAAKKAQDKEGDDDATVKALKRTVARMKKAAKNDESPLADEKGAPTATPMVHKKHIKILERGKLHLPKHFHVPTKSEMKKQIDEDTPAAIHTNPEYWKLKQLRAEYRYKKGYQAMREKLLRKELRRHYASKLVRDHMRRKVDTLRRERALDEYGPGAHYKPFTWGEYDEPSKDKKLATQASQMAKSDSKQKELRKQKNDAKKGKA